MSIRPNSELQTARALDLQQQLHQCISEVSRLISLFLG